jgi:transposase-like protein
MKVDPDCAIDLCRSGLLCQRYLILHVSSATVGMPGRGQPSETTIAYCLGVLQDGDSEIFVLSGPVGDGATCCPVGWEQLRDRGVESVRFVVSPDVGLASKVSGVFEGASVMPSLQSLLAEQVAGMPPRLLASARPALEQLCSALTAQAAQGALKRAAATEWAAAYPAQLAQWRDVVLQLRPVHALPARLRRVLRWADTCAAVLNRTLVRAIERHGPFVDRADAESFAAELLLRSRRRQGPCPDQIGVDLSPAFSRFTAEASRSRMQAPRP